MIKKEIFNFLQHQFFLNIDSKKILQSYESQFRKSPEYDLANSTKNLRSKKLAV